MDCEFEKDGYKEIFNITLWSGFHIISSLNIDLVNLHLIQSFIESFQYFMSCCTFAHVGNLCGLMDKLFEPVTLKLFDLQPIFFIFSDLRTFKNFRDLEQ